EGAGLASALRECGEKACTIGRRPRTEEEPDYRHRRLLRAHRERPGGRDAPDQGDELSAFNVDYHVTLHLGVNALRHANNTILFIGRVSDANGFAKSPRPAPSAASRD